MLSFIYSDSQYLVLFFLKKLTYILVDATERKEMKVLDCQGEYVLVRKNLQEDGVREGAL